MINYLDYPGDMKKRPSPAQVKQRHKWMLAGTLASMEARLYQLGADATIPPGKFKDKLTNAWFYICLARKHLKKTELKDSV